MGFTSLDLNRRQYEALSWVFPPAGDPTTGEIIVPCMDPRLDLLTGQKLANVVKLYHIKRSPEGANPAGTILNGSGAGTTLSTADGRTYTKSFIPAVVGSVSEVGIPACVSRTGVLYAGFHISAVVVKDPQWLYRMRVSDYNSGVEEAYQYFNAANVADASVGRFCLDRFGYMLVPAYHATTQAKNILSKLTLGDMGGTPSVLTFDDFSAANEGNWSGEANPYRFQCTEVDEANHYYLGTGNVGTAGRACIVKCSQNLVYMTKLPLTALSEVVVLQLCAVDKYLYALCLTSAGAAIVHMVDAETMTVLASWSTATPSLTLKYIRGMYADPRRFIYLAVTLGDDTHRLIRLSHTLEEYYAYTGIAGNLFGDPAGSVMDRQYSFLGTVPEPRLRFRLGALPDTAVGSSSTASLTIYNDGAAQAVITGPTWVNQDEFEFTAPPSSPFTVAIAGSQAITITFSPTAAGLHTANFTFATNDPRQPSVSYSIQAYSDPPIIEVIPSIVDFGDYVDPNPSPIPTKTVTLRNPGNTNVIVQGIYVKSWSMENATTNPFSFTTEVSAFTLAAQSEEALTLQFNPLYYGRGTCVFGILSDDPAAPESSFICRGTSSAGVLVISPSSLSFGEVNALSVSTRAVELKNSGNSSIILSPLSTTVVAGNGRFSIANASSLTSLVIPSGGTRPVTVLYNPLVYFDGTEKTTFVFTYRPVIDEMAELTVSLDATGVSGCPDYQFLVDGGTAYTEVFESATNRKVLLNSYAFLSRVSMSLRLWGTSGSTTLNYTVSLNFPYPAERENHPTLLEMMGDGGKSFDWQQRVADTEIERSGITYAGGTPSDVKEWVRVGNLGNQTGELAWGLYASLSVPYNDGVVRVYGGTTGTQSYFANVWSSVIRTSVAEVANDPCWVPRHGSGTHDSYPLWPPYPAAPHSQIPPYVSFGAPRWYWLPKKIWSKTGTITLAGALVGNLDKTLLNARLSLEYRGIQKVGGQTVGKTLSALISFVNGAGSIGLPQLSAHFGYQSFPQSATRVEVYDGEEVLSPSTPIQIRNSQAGSNFGIPWTITSSASWLAFRVEVPPYNLTAPSVSGTTPVPSAWPSGYSPVKAVVDWASLTPGVDYTTQIAIVGTDCVPLSVTLELTVQRKIAAPSLYLVPITSSVILQTPAGTTTVGGGLILTNVGRGNLDWTATSDDTGWLSLSPASGTIESQWVSGQTQSGDLALTANPTGLSKGTYICTLTIAAAAAANCPQTRMVRFEVY